MLSLNCLISVQSPFHSCKIGSIGVHANPNANAIAAAALRIHWFPVTSWKLVISPPNAETNGLREKFNFARRL
jgi:hypothetical protein